MNLVKNVLFTLLVISGMASCSKDDNSEVTYTATLNGASEVPANNSSATGTATLTFNKDTKVFKINVTHNVVNATAGHVHIGAIGTSGGVVFPFVTITSPISFTSTALTGTQEADLNAGLYYVNIHSLTYLGGEIRGQLIKK
ncbi:MAG: CHRD domain-containing protein [Saprospiraceae bacterium]